MEEVLKEKITELIKELKPEIRDRAAFKFGDYKFEDNKLVLADTAFLTKPPVITFYLQSIARIAVDKNVLKQIISHEIIHTFSKSERQAYGKQNKMNIFQEPKL
jgi:hypothetical protein